jgi:hypothetical protein
MHFINLAVLRWTVTKEQQVTESEPNRLVVGRGVYIPDARGAETEDVSVWTGEGRFWTRL